MNRHQSNPFLSDWGGDEDEAAEGAAANKERSVMPNAFADSSNDHKRLYHRNMSSFDAASLQLEYQQQQQQQEQLQDDPSSGDIIAKMTSEFQSAIETNDQEYGDHFDPFETIVDDDAISLPSPAPAQAQPNNGGNSREANESAPPADGGGADQPTDWDRKQPAKRDDDADGIVASDHEEQQPAAAAASQPVVASELPKLAGLDDDKSKETAEQLQDQLHRGTGEQGIGAKNEHPAAGGAGRDQSKNGTQTTMERPTGGGGEPASVEAPKASPLPSIARPRPVAANKPHQMIAQNFDYSPAKPITPRRAAATTGSKQTVKKKSSFQEDSSDSSSDEDDRIKIVIKASAETGRPAAQEAAGGELGRPALPVLLPPPPSKNAILQAREAGRTDQADVAGSSPFKCRQVLRRSSSSSSSAGSAGKRDDTHKPAAGDDEHRAEAQQREQAEEEQEQEREEEGQFVIPMSHSMDEDDDYTRPDTPLFDEDTSYALEEFPVRCESDSGGWEMMLRYPPKKKLTSNRFWKKIFVKLAQVPLAQDAKSKQQPAAAAAGQTCIALQIYDKPDDKKAMQEIPIQATYTVSDISSQQFDQFGKIFTIKLQYIFYKERVGVRQGQLARFIHTGHIGSSTTSGGHGVDPISIGAIKRIGAPIEHSPQISQIIKLGCTDYDQIRQFKNCLEDYLFRMPIQREPRAPAATYKTEEVQMAVRDETYVELNQAGQITRQLARVRLFFLSFLNGQPIVEVGINDIHRQGREVVGRMDILPVVTEEWIRLEACELHSTIDKVEFERPESRIIKLSPPDATFFELMRFRIRPPRNRELPLQISANMTVTRTKVSINCDVMVPGSVSRKHGQIPCEGIAIRVYMPECWIYFFREEKHFRMGSKKSVNRRPGKVKGIERFLGGGGGTDFDPSDESSLIEVTSGQAKYEHHHHSIVWRAARWPKESQSAYVQNSMKIRLPLTAYDKMPDSFYEYVHVEYTMPATTVSHTTLRSISVNPYEDEPAEKYVKYSAKYDYKVRMRLSVNVRSNESQQQQQASIEPSPVVIMKQPDLHGDLQREEDSEDDDDDDVEDDAAGHDDGGQANETDGKQQE